MSVRLKSISTPVSGRGAPFPDVAAEKLGAQIRDLLNKTNAKVASARPDGQTADRVTHRALEQVVGPRLKEKNVAGGGVHFGGLLTFTPGKGYRTTDGKPVLTLGTGWAAGTHYTNQIVDPRSGKIFVEVTDGQGKNHIYGPAQSLPDARIVGEFTAARRKSLEVKIMKAMALVS